MRRNEHPQNQGQRNYSLLLLCSLAIVAIVTTIPAVTACSTPEPDKERLAVNGPRPVALAAEMLEKEYGWIITYEDPPYDYESDLVDVTENVRRDLDKFKPGQAPRVFIPRGGDLNLEYDIDPDTRRPASTEVVIKQLLDAYNVGGPGTFRFEQNDQRVHIIGASARNKEGIWISHQSVLDAVITIPPQKRTGMMLLEAFCAAVSEASHTPVLIGMVPVNLFSRYETESGASNQKARDVLVNQLDRMNRRLSWRLFYDPSMKAYFMNIHAV